MGVKVCGTCTNQIVSAIRSPLIELGGVVERLYRGVRGAAIPGGSEEIMLDFGIRQGENLRFCESNVHTG